MKTWEDIVKERLEGYESPLPEGSLATFRTRREKKQKLTPDRHRPLVWAITAVAAASLATVLFLRHPSVPEEGIRIGKQPVTVVEGETGPDMEHLAGTGAELLLESSRPARTATTKGFQHPESRSGEIPDAPEELPDPETPASGPTEAEVQEADDVQTSETQPETPAGDDTAVRPDLPFIPSPGTPAQLNPAPLVGAVAGGGLLAALVSSGGRVLGAMDLAPVTMSDAKQENPPYESLPYTPDETLESRRHLAPFRLGFSAGIPVADRLRISTGLEYSRYASSFTYTRTGTVSQSVHYLGIPVRLDWMLTSGKWADLYIGGGFETDFCLAATTGGKSLGKDAPGVSLLGAGGVQLNLGRHIGLYVEPELSWRIPSEGHILETYRSENPLMFSWVTGLRINIGE